MQRGWEDSLSIGLEKVNHPPHYGGDSVHETIKCLESWGLERDALLWNAVKYISRAGKKDNLLDDLKKARWYLQRRIDSLENADKTVESSRLQRA